MTLETVWPQWWPSLILCGAPLALAWLADQVFQSRAAVRSLRLRAALLATIALAILPLLRLQLPRPTWLPAPIVTRLVAASAPVVAPQSLPTETEAAPPVLPAETHAVETQTSQIEAATTGKYLQRDSAINWPQIAMKIWLLGALILLSWSAFCHAHIARLRGRSQVLAEGNLFDAATEIARDWRMKAPRLLQTPNINSPFAIGVWRRAICWPTNFHSDENESWRAILRHEMAHVRRHDCAWNACAQIVCALLWPQPLLWWACRAIRRNAEDVCDEAALENCAPTIYARGLLDLSQNSAASTCSATRAASAGALPTQPELSRRVAAILRPGARDAWRVGWRTRAATVAALGLVIGLGAMLTSAPAQESDKIAASTSGAPKAPVKIDLSTPQATLDTFVAALKAGDARALVACIETENSAEELEGFVKDVSRFSDRLLVSKWRVEQQGNLATGHTMFGFDYLQGVSQKFDDKLTLKKLGSQWKIKPDGEGPRFNNTLPNYVNFMSDPRLKILHEWMQTHNGAAVEGQVLMADGSPASGATVLVKIVRFPHLLELNRMSSVLEPYSLSQFVQTVMISTDKNGKYVLKDLLGTKYSISAYWPVTPQDLSKARFDSDLDAKQIARAQEIKPQENTTIQAPVLKMQPTVAIEVQTLDRRTGQILKGLDYQTLKGLDYVVNIGSTTNVPGSSRKEGRTIIKVPLGKNTLALMSNTFKNNLSATATSRGIYATYREATVQLENGPQIPFLGTTTVTVEANRPRKVTVRLMPMAAVTDVSKTKLLPPIDNTDTEIKRLRSWARNHGRAVLTGQVLAADGSPAANATVRVNISDESYRQAFPKSGLNISTRALPDALNKMQAGSAVTDQNGNYRIEGLTGATYWLSAFWPATPSGPEVPYYGIDYKARQIALGQEVITSEGQTTQAPILKTQPTTRLDVLTVDANDGQPLQGAPYIVSIRQGKTITRIERASGTDGHAILNVPVGKIGLALASNVSTIAVSGKPRISGVRTARGSYLNQTQATIQIEDDTPISYKGVNSFTVTAGQTRHITVRLTPLSTP